MFKTANKRQAHTLREQALRDAKARREAKGTFVCENLPTFAEVLADLARSRLTPVKTNAEFEADRQESQAVMLGQLAAWLVGFGWSDDAGAFAANAFGKAGNAWRLRNPEPMMKEVHKFFLRKNGCNVDFQIKFD